MRRILLEPDRRGDPPALAVPEQLQRVDPAPLHGAVGGAPLLVRAPHLRDVAVRARDAVDLPLVEALVDELRVRRVMDHQAFVDATDSEFVHEGFYEREIHRVTRAYGNITQVWSTYEERRAPDGPVQGRGINALQLFWDGKRWWVASAIWFEEDPAHPIPQEFLP